MKLNTTKLLSLVIATICVASIACAPTYEDYVINIDGKDACWGKIDLGAHSNPSGNKLIGIEVENCKTGNADLMTKYIYQTGTKCIVPYRYINAENSKCEDPNFDRKFCSFKISNERESAVILKVYMFYVSGLSSGLDFDKVTTFRQKCIENINAAKNKVNAARSALDKSISEIAFRTQQIESGKVDADSLKAEYEKKKAEVDQKHQQNGEKVKALESEIAKIEQETAAAQNELNALQLQRNALVANFRRRKEEESKTPLTKTQLESTIIGLTSSYASTADALIKSVIQNKAAYENAFKAPLTKETKKKIESFVNPFAPIKSKK